MNELGRKEEAIKDYMRYQFEIINRGNKEALKILLKQLILIKNGLGLIIIEVDISSKLFVGNALIKLGSKEDATKD